MTGNLEKIPLHGYIDIALEKRDQRCVVDLKLSGKKYKMDEFENNSALQLAIYAYLFGGGEAADFAYFIIDTASWITQQKGIIKNSTIVPSKNGTLDDFRTRILNTWNHRQTQLERAIIEIPSDDDELPAGCLDIKEFVYPAEDYSVLLGLEEIF